MKKTKLRFLSADGKTRIYTVKWEPDDGDIIAVLQISHGMIEFVERYEEFAEYLTGKGFMVVGNDHLGHGASVISKEYWGYFAPKKGSDLVVKDLHKIRVKMQKDYPNLPYFMLGHSMGSFLLRKYISRYGKGLAGAVIMGTGSQPDALVEVGKAICWAMAQVKGWNYRSNLVDHIAFSGNDKKFQEEETSSWLTKDTKIAEAYRSDPRCTYKFTLNGFYNLFDTIHDINQKKHIHRVPKELPLLFVSGEDDPVGQYGKGVKKAYGLYQRAGVRDMSCKLYPGDRHEILNETDRAKVYQDIYQWMRVRL